MSPGVNIIVILNLPCHLVVPLILSLHHVQLFPKMDEKTWKTCRIKQQKHRYLIKYTRRVSRITFIRYARSQMIEKLNKLKVFVSKKIKGSKQDRQGYLCLMEIYLMLFYNNKYNLHLQTEQLFFYTPPPTLCCSIITNIT